MWSDSDVYVNASVSLLNNDGTGPGRYKMKYTRQVDTMKRSTGKTQLV